MTEPCQANTVELLEARGDDLSIRAARLIALQQDRLYELSQRILKLESGTIEIEFTPENESETPH